MKRRSEKTHELEGVWQEGNLKSGLQEDSCNCGPFVLKNVLALVKGHVTDQKIICETFSIA